MSPPAQTSLSVASCLSNHHMYDHAVIPKSLPVLSTEPVLRKVAVDRELGLLTEPWYIDIACRPS